MDQYRKIVKDKIKNILEKEPSSFTIDDNIIVIKNWISDKLCDKLVNHVESFDEKVWWEENKREWWHGKFLSIKDEEIKKELNNIRTRSQELFGTDLWIHDISSIHRMTKGQFMFKHADNLTESIGIDNKCVFGITHYLSNFNGGEICYPLKNIEYKPNKGDLVIHPASEDYLHSTKPVEGKNTRYIIATFASLTEAETINKNRSILNLYLFRSMEYIKRTLQS